MARRAARLVGPIDHEQFIALLGKCFPAIAAEITADECIRGLLHCEMHIFARAAQAAITNEALSEVKAYFSFIDDVFRLGTPDVRNAVCVSFLEHLGFDGRHGHRIDARGLLSPQLQVQLRDLEAYNANLADRAGIRKAGCGQSREPVADRQASERRSRHGGQPRKMHGRSEGTSR